MSGLDVQRRQVDGDAVEAGVHVLPAVGVAVAAVGLQRAEVGGDQDVDDGQASLRGFASWLARSACGHSDHRHALVGREAACDEVDQRLQARDCQAQRLAVNL